MVERIVQNKNYETRDLENLDNDIREEQPAYNAEKLEGPKALGMNVQNINTERR